MSIFSARHYNTLARTLKEAQESSEGLNPEERYNHLLNCIADTFAEDNERFQRERFIEAAKWGQDE